jgi:uncharacterized repeat protein (TIGR03803 family)
LAERTWLRFSDICPQNQAVRRRYLEIKAAAAKVQRVKEHLWGIDQAELFDTVAGLMKAVSSVGPSHSNGRLYYELGRKLYRMGEVSIKSATKAAKQGGAWGSGIGSVSWRRCLLLLLLGTGGNRLTVTTNAAAPYQRLLSFGAPGIMGAKPYVGVVNGNDGLLYGTTLQGGTNGAGTVFKINRDGSGYGVLHQFITNGLDGQSPGGLMLGNDGTLYGTTSIGGTNKGGTIYKINRDGAGYDIVHRFGTIAGDGVNPQAELLEGSDGALYGTTFFGGSGDMGTVFALNKGGSNYRVLTNFTGFDGDGGNPDTALVQGKDGALYGTTFFGGTNDVGTVFKLNRDGTGYTVLRSFSKTGGDGNNPDAALMQGSDGALFGTTSAGGTNNAGTLFKLSTNGTGYAVLHYFSSMVGDGQKPLGALVEGNDRALYGTTYLGGSNGVGAIFMVSQDASGYNIVRSFNRTGGDGQNPRCTLALGSDGVFYGTTWSGGDLGFGTVFQLLPTQTPEMLGVIVTDNLAQARFTGSSGFQYQVLRSTDLASWTVLRTITMPSSGIYTNLDSAPPNPTAFYQAAWTP